MNPLKTILKSVVGALVALITQLLKACRVDPTPYEGAIRLAAVVLVGAVLAGIAVLGGESIDWKTILPLLGEMLAPV